MNNLQNNSGVLINAKPISEISVTDRGIAYGDGVYRTFMVKYGTPLLWSMQYQKLVQDAHALGLSVCSEQQLLNEIQSLSDQEACCVIKVIITRGEGARGYAIPEISQHNRIVIKSDYPKLSEHTLTHGAKLFLCELRLSHQAKLAGIKHLNRLENVLARSESRDPAWQDGLLLDKHGNVIECTSGNIFARFDDQLVTPKLDQCGVAGVVRDWLLQNASRWSLKVEQTTLSLSQLEQASEVLMTNSVVGAINITQLSDKTWLKNDLAKQIRFTLEISP